MMGYQPTGQCSSPTYRLLSIRLKFYHTRTTAGVLSIISKSPHCHQLSPQALQCVPPVLLPDPLIAPTKKWWTLDPRLYSPLTHVKKMGLLTM
jgi:hypothetical protein